MILLCGAAAVVGMALVLFARIPWVVAGLGLLAVSLNVLIRL